MSDGVAGDELRARPGPTAARYAVACLLAAAMVIAVVVLAGRYRSRAR